MTTPALWNGLCLRSMISNQDILLISWELKLLYTLSTELYQVLLLIQNRMFHPTPHSKVQALNIFILARKKELQATQNSQPNILRQEILFFCIALPIPHKSVGNLRHSQANRLELIRSSSQSGSDVNLQYLTSL
jgi:hypothetical protein